MKAKEIREMTQAELEAKLAGLKSELYALRFSQAMGQLDNSSQICSCKKDIARVLTVLRARELAAETKKA